MVTEHRETLEGPDDIGTVQVSNDELPVEEPDCFTKHDQAIEIASIGAIEIPGLRRSVSVSDDELPVEEPDRFTEHDQAV